jgi:hypothetical protein
MLISHPERMTTMTLSRFSFSLLYALLAAGLAMSMTGCFGTGTLDGSIGVNITDQPVWGPSGYDHADYYYIPDIDCYYSVSERQYIYRNGSSWTHTTTLPSSYNTHDPYRSYKVVINEDKPYQNNVTHRAKYGSFIGMKDQPVIRDSRDPKYFANKDHPEHGTWLKTHGH